MTVVELLVLVLATTEIVEIFRHSQLSLVAGLRAWLQAGTGWLSQLTSCMFCLSVWIAWLVVALAVTAERVVYGEVLWWLLAGLAVARGANLVNDLTHHWTRTPGDHGPDDEGEPDSRAADEPPGVR